MDNVIETRDLTKCFGATVAVDRLSLTVPKVPSWRSRRQWGRQNNDSAHC